MTEMMLSKRKVREQMNRVGIRDFRELASEVGVSHWTISAWFSGKYNPSWDNLTALCDALRCTPNDLIVVDLGKAMALAGVRMMA